MGIGVSIITPNNNNNNNNNYKNNDNNNLDEYEKYLKENNNSYDNNSNEYHLPVPKIFQAISKYKVQLQYLHLTEGDILRLYHIYSRLKENQSNEVSVSKILNYFDLHDTLFLSRLFNLLTNIHNGFIPDFIEFVLILWQFCTIGKNLAFFIYDIYTPNGKQLDIIHGDEMIKEIFGKKYDKTNMAIRLNRELQHHAPNGYIHRWYFHEFCLRHPFLISPCTNYQKHIMDRVLGRNHWNKLTQNRIIQYKGHYKTIFEIYKILNDLKPIDDDNNNNHNHNNHNEQKNRLRNKRKKKTNNNNNNNNSDKLLQKNNSNSFETSDKLIQPSLTTFQIMLKQCKQIWKICSNEIFDNRTVIVRPLPPIEAPESIKSLTHYDALSISYNQPDNFLYLKQKKDKNTFVASGGLSEVKSLLPNSIDNSMIVEDIS